MLTALVIQNAKPREKSYKLGDGNGLGLLVEPNGSKLWRLRYHFQNKEKMLTLGPDPDVRHGFKIRGSDDFNIGVVKGGKLVSFDWMEKPLDYDLNEVAEYIGLRS